MVAGWVEGAEEGKHFGCVAAAAEDDEDVCGNGAGGGAAEAGRKGLEIVDVELGWRESVGSIGLIEGGAYCDEEGEEGDDGEGVQHCWSLCRSEELIV